MSSREVILQRKQSLTQAPDTLDHAPCEAVKKRKTSLLNPRYVPGSKALKEAHSAFASRSVAGLPELFAPDALECIKAEGAKGALMAMHRDFIMPGFETPRKLEVINGTMVTEHLPFIRSLYSRREIKTLLEEIVGRQVFVCGHANEFVVVNYLVRRGQTHGWHLDDPDYALVVAIDVPRHGGGVVEMVPGFTPGQQVGAREIEKRVEAARADGSLTTLRLEQGDAYVLHASSVLHRVTELEAEDDSRAVINFAYCANKKQQYGKTGDMLYEQGRKD